MTVRRMASHKGGKLLKNGLRNCGKSSLPFAQAGRMCGLSIPGTWDILGRHGTAAAEESPTLVLHQGTVRTSLISLAQNHT